MPMAIAIGLVMAAPRGLRDRKSTAIALCVLAFGCGALLAGLAARPAPIAAIARSVPRCDIEAIVREAAGSFGDLIAVTSLRCPEEVYSGDLGAAVAAELEGQPGATVTGQGWLLPLTSDRSDSSARRLGASARVRFGEVAIAPPTGTLHRVPGGIRTALVDATRDISPRSAALLRGLAIGDTSEIDHGTVDRFRDSGLAHLLAVSGSNVAIVLAAAAVAARRSSLRARAGLAAACLVLFVLVVGPEPSVLRAAAMGSLALVALVTGRTTEPLAALGVATVAVIVLRPEMVHSPGLHLSVAATAGMILFSPSLTVRLAKLPRPVAVVLAATLAAQLAVAPVIIGTFGEVSLVAPVANLVAAPAVPPATILSLGAALLHRVWPPLGRAAMAMAEPFGAWILWVADATGAVPYAAIGVPRVAGFLVALPVGWFTVVAARRRVG